MRSLTLNRVRDKIVIREGDEVLPLYVDCDANTLMKRIQEANKGLEKVNEQTGEEEQRRVALDLASAIFGEEQAEQLMAFYHDNSGCVVTICGMYFGDAKHGLGRKITKAQKRRK